MNQKGFIPIIFIIIGAVVVVSATFGVVKYKDETASVVKFLLKRPEKVVEETEKVEEPAVEEDEKEQLKIEPKIEEKESEEKEKQKVITEESIEQLTEERLHLPTDQIEAEIEKNANIKDIDKELSQIISEIKQRVDIFSQAKNEADSLVPTIRDTMSKYPTYSLIQQSGQQLINELNNLSFIAEKLIDIENDRIETTSFFLGSGNIPSSDAFSTSKAQYESYRYQYEISNNKIKSLMETFVANEKVVLEEILEKKQEELQRQIKATQIVEQLAVITQEIDSQLATLDNQIKEKEAEIEETKNRPISMYSIEARVAKLISELNPLIDQWNSLLDTRKKIVTITYKLDDYANYGIPLSAEDKTFLWSLGISF